MEKRQKKEIFGTKAHLAKLQGNDKAGKRTLRREVYGRKNKDPTEVGRSRGKKVRY